MSAQPTALQTFMNLILTPWLTGAAAFLESAEKSMMQALAQAQLDLLQSQPEPLTPTKIIAIHDLLVSFLFAYRADMNALQNGGTIPRPHDRLRKLLKEPARKSSKPAPSPLDLLQNQDSSFTNRIGLSPTPSISPDIVEQQANSPAPFEQPVTTLQTPTPSRSEFLKSQRGIPKGLYHEKINPLPRTG